MPLLILCMDSADRSTMWICFRLFKCACIGNASKSSIQIIDAPKHLRRCRIRSGQKQGKSLRKYKKNLGSECQNTFQETILLSSTNLIISFYQTFRNWGICHMFGCGVADRDLTCQYGVTLKSPNQNCLPMKTEDFLMFT